MTETSERLYVAARRNEHCLLWDQMGRNGRLLYTVTMMTVHPDEAGLSNGRFRRFRITPHEISVTVTPASCSPGDPWQVVVARLINWIAEQDDDAADGWSLAVTMRSVFDGDLIFSFASEVLAVLFALTFS